MLKREFLPQDFQITTWDDLKDYFNRLLDENISSTSDLRQWFHWRSELESVVSEDGAWRYIRMTCNTEDAKVNEEYLFFVKEIQPQIAPISDQLNKITVASPYFNDLSALEGYDILAREMRKDIEIFREKNVPLFTQLQTKAQQYGQISGAMTVDIHGEEKTLQQAAVELQSTDRAWREEVYKKMSSRRLLDSEELDGLFNELVELRAQVSKNTGFNNFRDYMFKAMGRFDYTPQDCFDFHDSILTEVVPIVEEIAKDRKKGLNLDSLRPWDKAVDIQGRPPLKAFKSEDDLIEKGIICFNRIDPYFGSCLSEMKEMNRLDLVSRKGKAPGGYNYPLPESGVPFIFMNATSTLRDMVTLMHEGGHAVHAFLTDPLEITEFKNAPAEVAELASMSMELISMDHWDIFFTNEEDLLRAKKEHLEQVLETLPWVATIDKFQHWIYENHDHSEDDRRIQWNEILNMFSDSLTNWEGLEEIKDYLWQRQLHLYEVPFYYIEYGMAQLGAIAIWKNYCEDNKAGLEGYKNALKLGYTKTIPDIYRAAGIRFDFSRQYISELMSFIKFKLGELTMPRVN